MNDLIEQQTVLHHRDPWLRAWLVLLPIGCLLGVAVVWGELQNADMLIPVESTGYAQFRLITHFMLVSMPCAMAFYELTTLRLIQPIQVQADGLRLRHFLGSWQNIPWSDITAIQQLESTRRTSLFKTVKSLSWVVQTRCPAKFAISPRTTIKFTITESHDHFRALLDLIKAETGLSVEKKRNLPQWQNHGKRM